MKDVPYDFFMLPFSSYKTFIVDALKKAKKESIAYTVNSVQDVQNLYDMGIRSFMTDNIPMIIQWLRDTHTNADGHEHAE